MDGDVPIIHHMGSSHLDGLLLTNLLYQIIKYRPKVNYIDGISAFVEWYKKYYR